MPKNNPSKKPRIIDGGLAIDDRGRVAFVNDFDFKNVKRFYIVSSHQTGFVRAWHAHKKEAKYIMVIKGAAVVAAVVIDDFEKPSKEAKVHRHVLSENIPRLFYIPAGYANGFMSLTKNAQLIFFSTSTLDESEGDDIRYNSRYWDIWSVEER